LIEDYSGVAEMDHELTELLTRLVQVGNVSENDVLELRDAVWTDEPISQPLVDSLFSVNDHCKTYSASWTDFLIEVVEHYLLHQKPPEGFIDDAGSAWLRARVDKNGRVTSQTEIELLVSVLETAENAPESLKNYALTQIEATIAFGEGPTRSGDMVRPNCVDDAEVKLLRRLVFAGGGEGAAIVGAKEADLLFRIKDRALGNENAPSWQLLFVQGVGNHLMAHSDYRPLSFEEAARFTTEMDIVTPSVAGFFKRMVPSEMIGRGTIVEAFKAVFPKQRDGFAKKMAIDNSHLITDEEAAWLKVHIVADGQTDEYEQALLTFIIDEAGNAPSNLESVRLRA
jgi:hypothetical protein